MVDRLKSQGSDHVTKAGMRIHDILQLNFNDRIVDKNLTDFLTTREYICCKFKFVLKVKC